MFTGIVQTTGEIKSITPKGGDIEIVVAAPALGLSNVTIGDSIAVNGCCLTVTRKDTDTFAADVSRETLNVTTLGTWTVGRHVNLETALTAGQALGGHYVTGHVDGIAQVTSMHTDARSTRIDFEVPSSLAKYVAKKGSACIDGVSLTVNDVAANKFSVNLIPHTLAVTVLKDYRIGTRVNFEVDIIARYLERLTSSDAQGR